MGGLLPETGAWTTFLLWWGMHPSTPPTWSPRTELSEILNSGLGPTLGQFASSSRTRLDRDVAVVIQRDAFARQARSHAAVRAAVPELERLNSNGVDFVVLKGPGIACCYPGALTRPFSDLDVLVAPRQFRLARRLLDENGWKQSEVNEGPWPFFDRWCREGVNLVNTAKAGNIDLHHRPSPWLWSAHMGLSEMFARSSPQTWYDTELRCLAEVDNLLVSALQLISDHVNPGCKLLNWRDLAVLANRVDPVQAAAVAARADLCDFVLSIFAAMPHDVVPGALVSALTRQSNGRLPHARRLSALADRAGASRRLIMQSHALRLPTATAVVYLAGSTFPSSTFIRVQTQGRRTSYPGWWRYALRRKREAEADRGLDINTRGTP